MSELLSLTNDSVENNTIKSRLSTLSETLKLYTWNVFIDGPADAGKGTACNFFIEYLGMEKIETGNMYRAVTVWLKKQENLTNVLGNSDYMPHELGEALINLHIDFRKDTEGQDHVWIGQGQEMLDVTSEIEADWVNARISSIAQQSIVRDVVERWQINLLKKGSKVIEGRDMWQFMRKRGVKSGLLIYIYASDDELAKREVVRKEIMGIPVNYDEALLRITQRNQKDNLRKRGQLLTPEQAQEKGKYDLIIDTTNLAPEEVLLKMMETMEKRISRKSRFKKILFK